MLNSDLRFPYPLLRNEAVDFQTAVFSDDLDILRERDGFRIVPRFSVNNSQIQKLLDADIFSYGIQIQCSSTYYRVVEYIKNNSEVFIPGGTIHDQVEVCPCIVAMEDLVPYLIEDSVAAFHQFSVGVYSSDVVGIGKVRRFRAYYKADQVKKASSVITVQVNKEIDRINIDLGQPNIYVYLPQDQFKSYMDLGVATSDQVKMLMGLIYVPAITQALSVMDVDGDSEFANLPWYKSLMASLDKLAGGDPEKISELIENPFETAQRLIGDNVSTTLQILKNRDW